LCLDASEQLKNTVHQTSFSIGSNDGSFGVF